MRSQGRRLLQTLQQRQLSCKQPITCAASGGGPAPSYLLGRGTCLQLGQLCCCCSQACSWTQVSRRSGLQVLHSKRRRGLLHCAQAGRVQEATAAFSQGGACMAPGKSNVAAMRVQVRALRVPGQGVGRQCLHTPNIPPGLQPPSSG